MKTQKSIQLQSASKGNVFFNIEIEERMTLYNQALITRFLGKYVGIKILQNKKCISIESFDVDAKILEFIKLNFGVNMPKQKTCFTITDESWNDFKALEADFEKRVDALKKERQVRIDALPVRYYMYDSFDWGDYTSDKIRKIKLVRDRLEDETHGLREGIVVKELILNNSRIGQYEGEWNESIKALGGDINDSKMHLMDEELIEKWQGIFNSILSKEVQEGEAKEKAKREAEEAEKARYVACFKEAEETCKPVLLYSTFLQGDQIPRRMRDEDSDMGSLKVYAMPDGTRVEKFFHAY